MPGPLADLLALHGYAVVFKQDAWVECLLLREDERWLGRGRDENEALDDAVRQACPSHLARTLLVEAPPTSTADLHGDTGEVRSAADSLPAEHTNGTAAPATPADAVDVAAHVDAAEQVVTATVDRAEETKATPAQASNGTSKPNAASASELAADALDDLLDEIADGEEELALCSPLRQRLVLLAWIARARAIQDDCEDDDDDVDDLVTRIAGKLGAFARRWWPGSVPALQQAAWPSDAGRVLPGHPEPTSWEEVADLAEDAVCELEARGDADGLDDYGWSDAKMVEAAPSNATAMLDGVVATLDHIDPDEPQPDGAQLVRLAQQLRWLRGACDVTKWSKAIGDLRRIAHQHRITELSRVLDPAFVPPRPWAALLGAPARRPDVDPHVRRLEVERVVANVPVAGDREALRGWLRQALPLTDTHHVTIADAVRNHIEAISTFTVEDFAGMGRRFHRRLRKLQETLSGEPPSGERISDPSLPSLPVVSDAEGTVDPNVVSRTRGRRAVFISNRNDPDHQTRLRDVLQLSELDWTEYQPRKIDAVVQAIAHNRYDLVIAATGFLNHKVDGKLARACRDAGIPYIRANHGRVGACVRALERDLAS